MLVKAKWNVKDKNGWHKPGDVFITDEKDLDGVETLEPDKREEPVKKETEEPEAEQKPKAVSRRKKISE